MTLFVVRMDVRVDLDVARAQELAHPWIEQKLAEGAGLKPNAFARTATEAADLLAQEPAAAVSAALAAALQRGLDETFGDQAVLVDLDMERLPDDYVPGKTVRGPA